MQADIIKRISGIIIMTAAVTALLLIGRHVPFGAKNSVFYIESTERIYSIAIRDENNNKLELFRRNGDWFLEDGIKVRKAAIDLILRTIRNIRIKSPVSDESFNHFVDSESTEHLKVQIYGKNRLIQSFLVYKDTDGASPGIIKRREASRPFLVHIPGEDADPAMHFIADREFWVPNIVFAAGPDEISGIKVIYTDKPDSSFHIEKKGRNIDLSFPDCTGKPVDTLAVGRYLSYYNYIPYESYAYDLSPAVKDSISADPFYLYIEMMTVRDDTTKLMAWTRSIMKGDSMVTDTDRLWGSINGGDDLFVMSYYDLDPLIKYPSYFISD